MDDGTNQRPPGVKQDDIVLEFTRRALGGRRVSKEAWIAACRVAETAIREAQRVVPVEMVEASFTRILSAANLKLVDRQKHGELVTALTDFGMRQFPTDSNALARVKRAYADVRCSNEQLRVPNDAIQNGLPLPPLPDEDGDSLPR
jgi:hypothetical protein